MSQFDKPWTGPPAPPDPVTGNRRDDGSCAGPTTSDLSTLLAETNANQRIEIAHVTAQRDDARLENAGLRERITELEDSRKKLRDEIRRLHGLVCAARTYIDPDKHPRWEAQAVEEATRCEDASEALRDEIVRLQSLLNESNTRLRDGAPEWLHRLERTRELTMDEFRENQLAAVCHMLRSFSDRDRAQKQEIRRLQKAAPLADLARQVESTE